jgi:hypothetical protein
MRRRVHDGRRREQRAPPSTLLAPVWRFALRRILYSRAFWRLIVRLGLWRFVFRRLRAFLGKRLAGS